MVSSAPRYILTKYDPAGTLLWNATISRIHHMTNIAEIIIALGGIVLGYETRETWTFTSVDGLTSVVRNGTFSKGKQDCFENFERGLYLPGARTALKQP